MDISDDSKLIITCSADKNVKIWGLDFGDCHKSIFAHNDSVMQVAFEKGSHYFWSVGKDKMLKYWDGDKVGVAGSGSREVFNHLAFTVRKYTEFRRPPWGNLGFGTQPPRQFCGHCISR